MSSSNNSGYKDPITINDALENIRNEKYLLPVFQRDFLWKYQQIEMLFDSIMRGYPIGSFLFWKVERTTKSKWTFYKFLDKFTRHQVNEYKDSDPDKDWFYCVLDGQQRLTGFNIAFNGTYADHEPNKRWTYEKKNFPPRLLYLKLRENKEEDENDINKKYIFNFLKEDDTKSKIIYIDNHKDKWLRVSAIKDLRKEDDINSYIKKEYEIDLEPDEVEIIKLLIKRIYEDKIITYYLEVEQKPDKALRIFTRTNSGGTPLSFYDIVFSFMCSNWKTLNAKDELNDLMKCVQQEKKFNIDKQNLIKTFLYLFHHSVKTEVNSFDITLCTKIEEHFSNIREAILALFDLLISFKFNKSILTSYNAILPVLYYMYHGNKYDGFDKKEGYESDRKEIKKRITTSILRQVFGGQSDTTLQKSRGAFATTEEIKEGKYIDPSKPFSVADLKKAIVFDVEDSDFDKILNTQKENKNAFIILAFLYLDKYDRDSIDPYYLQKDHLHPMKNYELVDKDLQNDDFKQTYNSIVNLQLLKEAKNKSKNDKPLTDRVDDKMKEEKLEKDAFLDKHLIPKGVSLEISDIKDFFEERKEILKNLLKDMIL